LGHGALLKEPFSSPSFLLGTFIPTPGGLSEASGWQGQGKAESEQVAVHVSAGILSREDTTALAFFQVFFL
jgi:hypothetical protein